MAVEARLMQNVYGEDSSKRGRK